MTGRERINAICNCEPTDRLSWTILCDERSLGFLRGELAGKNAITLCKTIGCDIFQWSGLGLGAQLALRNPIRDLPDVKQIAEQLPDGKEKRVLHSSFGELSEIYAGCHPVKYMLETLEDVRCFMRIWETCEYHLMDESAALAEIELQIGDDGILVKALDGTAIPTLLENLMGVEKFYYLLADHPVEMDALITLIHEKDLQRMALVAAERGPDKLLLIENTSTTYISPSLYRQYNLPHVRDFCRIAREHGKKAIIHMCGHIRNLLDPIKQTHLDGIHGLTPPPVGDTPFEVALDAWENESAFFICFADPGVLARGSAQDVRAYLDALYTPRIRQANMILCAAIDGVEIPADNLWAMAEWFETNGERT